jgi:hypothetical protein
MVFVRDEGSLIDAPPEAVWAFVSSGDHHSEAHRHRHVRRRVFPDNSGRYSWEQDFLGRPEKFTMEWVSYYPVGVAYQVTEGPFSGSKFFLYYVPRADRTEVRVVGDFVSPSLPTAEIPAAVDRFFSVEFDQDRKVIEADHRSMRKRPRSKNSARRPTGRRRVPRRSR